jgi:crotonobetainyl-CoA:carnitine CoA-transferase CaiB-like acyl-CoA transferase
MSQTAAGGPIQATPPTADQPLRGIRVVDLTTVIFGPYASQYLGDYGADIIKIETETGDTTRAGAEAVVPGVASGFISTNRNKRSVVINLKQAKGRAALLRIVDGADVVMHNIRPQKLAAIGLDPATVRARNPRVIYASLNGFSEAGPYAGRPAYDDIVQGMSGLADLMQRASGQPGFLPTIAADKTCANVAVHAILAALMGRERTGQGTSVEISMFETMAGFAFIEHMGGQTFVPGTGPTGYARVLSPQRKPFRTRDGYLCLMPHSTAHWMRFFTAAGHPELAADPRFANHAERTRNVEVLYGHLAGILVGRTTKEWMAFCTEHDVPHGPVNTLDDLFTDPHLDAVGFFRSVPAGDGHSTMRLTGNGVRFEGEMLPVRRSPPRLGEHTREVLKEAGLERAEIDELLAEGVARQAT